MNKSLPAFFKVIFFSVLFSTSYNSSAQCPIFNATATPSFQAICSGASITTILLSGNVPGTTFEWSRDNTATVSGIAATGTGNISGTLTSTTNAPVTVSFTIIPMTGFTQTINESFNTILPPGWAQQNLSSPAGSSPTWYAGTTFPPYSPTGYIGVNKNSAAPGGIISNWLFTPEIQIKNGDQYSFYTRSIVNGGDNMEVRLSINGPSVNVGSTSTSVGDFQYYQFEMNPAGVAPYPNFWRFVTATVYGLPPGVFSGRLAFRYYSPFPGLQEIGIDNFIYYSASATSCIGQPIITKVFVNPNATVNLIPNQTLCDGASTAAVNFNSPATGGTIVYNWTNSNTAIGFAASGTGNIPSFIATNTGATSITGTVNVTPTYSITNPFSFTNLAIISIPTIGAASPYSSSILVGGLPTSGIPLLGVRLKNMNHTAAGDLDIVLQSPTGQNVILMSDAGSTNNLYITNMLFQDGGAAIPAVDTIPSGTYACTNLAGTVEPDNWPAPGPGSLTQPNPSLSVFSSSFNHNGLWKLFVVDDENGNSGYIYGGWELLFGYPTTCVGTPTAFTYTVNPLPTVTISSNIPPPILPGQIMVLTATVSPPGGTFAWYKDGVLIPGATNNTLGGITVSNLGTYTVTYTDPNGCAVTSAGFNVYAKSGNNLYVYPNPTTGSFSISFYNEPNEEVTVVLYDLSGMKVFYKKYITGSQRYSAVSIDHQLTNGNYYAEVRNAKNQVIGLKQISITR